MVPDKDYYADKDGKLTDDASRAAIQVAVAGVHLDERIAKRYGIMDSLVSVDEPGAVRNVRSKVVIEKDDEEAESEPTAEEPDAEAAEPKAKKGAKKK